METSLETALKVHCSCRHISIVAFETAACACAQVNMEPGDMVMYESAKQYHARLTPMRGRHYGSVFIHYFPAADNWNWTM